MARATWSTIRDKAQRDVFDHFKESILVKSGARAVSLFGVLDTTQDAEVRAKSPPGTFPVLARLSVFCADLGWVPVVGELFRVSKTANPEREQAYCVVSVDESGDLLIVDMQANTSNGNPFFQ